MEIPRPQTPVFGPVLLLAAEVDLLVFAEQVVIAAEVVQPAHLLLQEEPLYAHLLPCLLVVVFFA